MHYQVDVGPAVGEVEQRAVPFTHTSCYGLAEMINQYVNQGWYLFKLEVKYIDKCDSDQQEVDAFGVAVFEREGRETSSTV